VIQWRKLLFWRRQARMWRTSPTRQSWPQQAVRDAHKAFRQVDAEKAVTEHEIVQKAFSANRERLKAERLAREVELMKGK
jgi:hypothetical protein